MKPTSIATGTIYTPLKGKIEDQIPPHNEDNHWDMWHVTMEDIGNLYQAKHYFGSFKTEEEARGFMAGWNAHRGHVSELLFRQKCSRRNAKT